MNRFDGREPGQLRPVILTPGWARHAEGSCLTQCGDTTVLCTVSVENGVPAWKRGSGSGWLTAEYGMLPRSTGKRVTRDATRGKPDGRTIEIQRLIGRSLRAAVDLQALGERTLMIDCDVLQADGGTRCAAITGAWVALAAAIAKIGAVTPFAISPLRDNVAAVSVGIVEGRGLLDLNYHEDSRASVDMNVVMTSAGELIEVGASGEGATFARSQLDQLLDLAAGGITALVAAQNAALAVI